jgi:hypothetical protein
VSRSHEARQIADGDRARNPGFIPFVGRSVAEKTIALCALDLQRLWGIASNPGLAGRLIRSRQPPSHDNCSRGELVRRLANENIGWGYTKIRDSLRGVIPDTTRSPPLLLAGSRPFEPETRTNLPTQSAHKWSTSTLARSLLYWHLPCLAMRTRAACAQQSLT